MNEGVSSTTNDDSDKDIAYNNNSVCISNDSNIQLCKLTSKIKCKTILVKIFTIKVNGGYCFVKLLTIDNISDV